MVVQGADGKDVKYEAFVICTDASPQDARPLIAKRADGSNSPIPLLTGDEVRVTVRKMTPFDKSADKGGATVITSFRYHKDGSSGFLGFGGSSPKTEFPHTLKGVRLGSSALLFIQPRATKKKAFDEEKMTVSFVALGPVNLLAAMKGSIDLSFANEPSKDIKSRYGGWDYQGVEAGRSTVLVIAGKPLFQITIEIKRAMSQ